MLNSLDCYDYIFRVLEHDIKVGDLESKEGINMYDCKYTILCYVEEYRVLKTNDVLIDIVTEREPYGEEIEPVLTLSYNSESLLVAKVIKMRGREYNIGLLLELSEQRNETIKIGCICRDE